MTSDTRLVTAEELFDMPSIDGRRELVRGKVVEMSPVTGRHGRVSARTAYIFLSHTDPRGLGDVWVGDAGVILERDPDTVRGPDVCFYLAGRLAEEDIDRGFTKVVPDIVVEVASPNDRPGEIRDKTRQWLDAGVQIVLNVYPQTRTVVISRTGLPDRTLRESDVLTCEPVLPEFSVPVAEIFA